MSDQATRNYFEHLAADAAAALKQKADAKAAAQERIRQGLVALIAKVAEKPKTLTRAEEIERRDARRARYIGRPTTFPNALGNYTGKRKPKPEPMPITGRERFNRLTAAYLAFAA